MLSCRKDQFSPPEIPASLLAGFAAEDLRLLRHLRSKAVAQRGPPHHLQTDRQTDRESNSMQPIHTIHRST
jgi:hypothetical protein